MKNWEQAKEFYTKDHLVKSLEHPERRLNALKAIEKTFKEKFPELLNDDDVFMNITKMYFLKLYQCLKGSSLSGAEKSVIAGLYKFSS
jgi:hypothetical protein